MTAADRPLPSPLAWPFASWFLPFWYAGIFFGWWRVFALELGRSGPAASSLGQASLTVATLLSVAGKLSGAMVEAGFYSLLWGSRGRRLPFWRFFCVVISASTLDLIAHALVVLARDHPSATWGWLWPIVGPQLLEGAPLGEPGALRAAFGTAGALTAVRILITAWAQAQALAVSLPATMALSVGTWLSTRILILWTVDLMKGMSPVSG